MAHSDEYLMNVISIYNQCKSVSGTAKILNLSRTTAQSQIKTAHKLYPKLVTRDPRAGINSKTGKQVDLTVFPDWTVPKLYAPDADIKRILIGGDAHFWPGEPPLMWKAFCKVAKQVKPDCIVLNGDILDGARVSRHARMYGSKAPTVSQEIEMVQKCLKMLPNAPHKIWTMGNHEMRFDNYLANNASELDEYTGSIKDRFRDWTFCWATNINNVEIRHRFRGGIHTGWNNALHAGINMVTNHTHQLQITAVRNRNGSHYGVEAGMLGDPHSPAFEYTEGAPSRSCPGFVLLSFDDDGYLLPPELAEMIRGRPTFRGSYVF
jgi:predicted MPP superfamily phosphohydrolase